MVGEINSKLAAVHLDRGYHTELLGEYQERQAAQSRLLESAIIAGVAILLLMHVSFATGGSPRSPSSPFPWRWSAVSLPSA